MVQELRARVRLEASGRDMEAALRELSPLYAGAAWAARPTDDAFVFRYAAVGDGAMTLRTSRIHGSLGGEIPPGDEFIVQWVVSGRGAVSTGRDTLEFDLGRPALFPAHRPFRFDFADYDQKVLHLDKRLVEQVASERFLLAPGALRLDHRRRPSDAAVGAWHRTVGEVTAALRLGEAPPLLWAELTRRTADALLDLYPPDAPEAPPELLLARATHVRAAVEFIRANAHLPLTATDIAASAALTPRGLQKAFERLVGESPIAHLRRVRLDHVRAELLSAHPARTSVSDVARRWGFAHLGRFSAAYAARFGEYPRATLHT